MTATDPGGLHALAAPHAVVTGAAGGIGSAIVRHLLAAGAVVHGIDRDARRLAQLAEELRQGTTELTPRFHAHCMDLAERADAERATARLIEALAGRCDVLVNNAGISRLVPFAETDEQLLDALMAVNLTAPFRLTRALLPLLAAGGRAAIINIASELALIGQSGYSAYCATKGAILAWTRALAVELAPRGIRVNAVCPGPVDTPMLRAEFETSAQPERARRAEVATIPLGRLGEPRDIAAVVAFLASDEAAFVTGAAWPVDGGKTSA